MSSARWTPGLTVAADASLRATTPTVRLIVVGGGALLLLAVLVTVLVVLVRRRLRVPPPPHGRRRPPADDPPRTVLAWQPDPAPGLPPGAVPQQPPTGPRPR